MLCTELPKKNTSFKKGKNGTKYVYLAIKRYRNQNGVPTAKEVCIGKLDNESGYLVPNKNFPTYFPNANYIEIEKSNEKSINIYTCGAPLTYLQLAENIDLTRLLKMSFPDDYEQIIHLAGYIAFEGNIMNHFSAWAKEQDFPSKFKITSQKISTFLAKLDEEKQLEFIYQWKNNKSENDYLYFDVTSISTYCENLPNAEFGYNRDNEFLPQINLGVLYGKNLNLPLSYNWYSGSLVDKSVLNFILNLYPSICEKNHTLVFDQGFFTKQNFKLLIDKKCTFITSLPRQSNFFQDSLLESLKVEWDIFELDPDTKLLQREFYTEYEGEKVKLFIFKDRDKAKIEEDLICERVFLQQKELDYINQSQKVYRKRSKFLEVDQNGNFELLYKLNHDQIKISLKKTGHFILISNDLNLNCKEALEAYRKKDVIEKFFRNLKNDLDFSRLRSKQHDTTRGKLFISFIAMIIHLELRNKLKGNVITKALSFKEIKDELYKIRYIKINSRIEQISLTKKQREIEDALGINLYKNKS